MTNTTNNTATTASVGVAPKAAKSSNPYPNDNNMLYFAGIVTFVALVVILTVTIFEKRAKLRKERQEKIAKDQAAKDAENARITRGNGDFK